MAKIITIEGCGISVDYAAVPADVAQEIIGRGATEERIDDIWSDCDQQTFGGLTEANIYLGDDLVKSVSTGRPTEVLSVGTSDPSEWIMVNVESSKGYVSKIDLGERDFDVAMIESNQDDLSIGTTIYATLSVTYDNIEEEFIESIPNSRELFLISSSGEKVYVEIVDEEDEEDWGED